MRNCDIESGKPFPCIFRKSRQIIVQYMHGSILRIQIQRAECRIVHDR